LDVGQFARQAGADPLVAADEHGRDRVLRVAGGESPPAAGVSPLDVASLGALHSAALTRLQAVGVSPQLLADMSAARLQVGSLAPESLVTARPGEGSARFDEDAAGYGWFVDPTPLQDEEFLGGVALPGSLADGRLDLLSAVFRGLGYLANEGGNGLMSGLLGAGRRLWALDAVFAGR
jgi:hypothetical protein